MPTTGTTAGVSTTNDSPVLLFAANGKYVRRLIVYNVDPTTADGYVICGLGGEARPLDANMDLNIREDLGKTTDIYIQRKAGGANMVNVRGYTLG